MAETPLFEKVALLGLGLLGSSLGHVIREKGLAKSVSGYARTARTRERALEIGFVDTISDTAAGAAEDADLTILCAPIGTLGALAAEVGPVLKSGSLLTDVGSVKRAVIRDVGPFVPEGVCFIPGHPIAGSELSGPGAGFADLFQERWCILTPLPDTRADALARLVQFWEACGSRVDIMDPGHHDLVLSITSHLPHLIAYNIVGTATDLEEITQSEVVKYSASGFRDFTRLAASDPTMWRDIFLNNKEAVLETLGRFSEDLATLQRAIRWGDGDTLHALFSRTRDIRRSIIDAGQDSPEPNFGRDIRHNKDSES